MLNKKNQDLMILETINLSRQQRMLKLRDSLSRIHALEKKPRQWLDNLLLLLQEDQKVNVLGHTKTSLKRLNISIRSLPPSQQSQEQK